MTLKVILIGHRKYVIITTFFTENYARNAILNSFNLSAKFDLPEILQQVMSELGAI